LADDKDKVLDDPHYDIRSGRAPQNWDEEDYREELSARRTPFPAGRGDPATLESQIIGPPPDNPPPGVLGDRPRQSTIRQGLGDRAFEPLPEELIGFESWAELHRKMHGVLDAILETLEENRPPIFTNSFRANFAGGAAWLGPVIPPQPGAALYVTSIWGFNSANVNAAFGQGTSTSDAEFFSSNIDVGSDLGALNNKAFTLNNDFPDWVFRCDPGKGLMVHAAGNCVIDGYLQYYARPLAEQKYR